MGHRRRSSWRNLITWALIGVIVGLILSGPLLYNGQISRLKDRIDELEGGALAEPEGTLTVAGSSTVLPITQEIANEFMTRYQRVEISVEEMGEKVVNIVKLAVELIETKEQSLIWKLSEAEAEIDEIYLRDLKTLGDSKANAKTVIANLLTIRYLERIADHASYVAESMTYAETGKRISLR